MSEIIMLSNIVLMPANWANTTRVAKWCNLPRTIVNRLLLPHNTIDIDLLQLSEQNMFFISRWEKSIVQRLWSHHDNLLLCSYGFPPP